jgi:hypothetical protein
MSGGAKAMSAVDRIVLQNSAGIRGRPDVLNFGQISALH